jgi:hypothetical protein
MKKQLTKLEFQKRSTLVAKLVELIELKQDQPHVEKGKKHPYMWTDNETLGVIEKEFLITEDDLNEED